MSVRSTLDEIRDRATGVYPVDALVGSDTALILFSAGFLGQQDGIFISDAGLRATCVDVDGAKLAEMAAVYPDAWEFVASDVFEYAAGTDRRWDVLSIDCPTNLFDECADHIDLWCRLAKVAVVLGVGQRTHVAAPRGWELTDRRYRSDFQGGVFWAVLERE